MMLRSQTRADINAVSLRGTTPLIPSVESTKNVEFFSVSKTVFDHKSRPPALTLRGGMNCKVSKRYLL